MKNLIALGALVALVGCASLTPSQQAKNVDTVSLNTYAVIGQVLDNREVTLCGKKFCDTKAEGVRQQAWTLVTVEHNQYLSGEYAAASASFQALLGLVKTAKGL